MPTLFLGSALPKKGHVYRFCTTDGLWLHKDNSSLPWRDLSECEESKRGDQSSPEQQLLSLYIIYTVGYALSFSALVIASAILLGFRHLHCTRNYIHLNLFASFILRALSVFIKDAALKWMYSTAARQHQWDGLLSYQDSLGCRLAFLLMQYCVAANYYWLLVEGVYLYTLLALSVFSEQRVFRLYLSIGWGYTPGGQLGTQSTLRGQGMGPTGEPPPGHRTRCPWRCRAIVPHPHAFAWLSSLKGSRGLHRIWPNTRCTPLAVMAPASKIPAAKTLRG
ncbi:glucagon-like peptide 1 receptor [Pontoporia blainvillei]|uniref:Glucagon-like peptide 1 receptor n=1 Tax=Pontoporia blainvillei TaxID=48723 RepID=A0ABX0S4I7_PONBL|nr:glucagon-like peptide 1 receptor [Pontoporia blainvillei]